MRSQRHWLLSAIMVPVAAAMAMPFYYIVVNTLKTPEESAKSPLGLPLRPTFAHYAQVIHQTNLIQSFFNTLYVTVFSVVLMVLVGSMAAYGMLLGRTKVTATFGGLLAVAFLVPAQATLIPIYQMLLSMQLIDKLNGLVAVYSCGAIFCYYLIIGYMRSVPTELLEAARIDGAGAGRIFISIVLPLIRPILITVSVFQTMWVWNDFIIPNVFISSPAKQTLVLQAYAAVGQFTTDWPVFMTLTVILLVPVVVFFLLMQRHIVDGLMQGSIKG
jgi:raffinose/stachyose/melibiose transport system permease protein